MTTITKLSIQGVRSYSDTAPESIEFFRPLTIIVGNNGCGKCFARGTRLRLFNGNTIAVEHIVGGEQLMGDDGQPRTVTPGTLVHHVPQLRVSDSDDSGPEGRQEGQEDEPLYRITPTWTGAQPFTVNGAHILVLTNNAKPFKVQRNDGRNNGYWRVYWWELGTDNVMSKRSMTRAAWTEADAQAEVDRRTATWRPLEWEVSVEDFLGATSGVRNVCMLMASKAVTFHNPALPSLLAVLTAVLGAAPAAAQVEYMAWWLGCWLADGDSGRAAVYQGGPAQPDPHSHHQIFAELLRYQQVFGQPVRQVFDQLSTSGSPVYSFSYGMASVAGGVLRAYNLIGNKHIPRALICDSLDVRWRLLAGLIDGDGHYRPVLNDYELPAKERDVCAGYKELAATLGLRNSDVHPHLNTDQQTGVQYLGHRVCLTGHMWDVVQYCAATYKQCPQPGTAGYVAKNKDSRCYDFTVRQLPEDKYFGFAVHGGVNRRFLLEDYTVTHNTVRRQSGTPSMPPSLRHSLTHVAAAMVSCGRLSSRLSSTSPQAVSRLCPMAASLSSTTLPSSPSLSPALRSASPSAPMATSRPYWQSAPSNSHKPTRRAPSKRWSPSSKSSSSPVRSRAPRSPSATSAPTWTSWCRK